MEKIALWDPPMRFNDTTRTYFEKLANLSKPEDAARYKALFDPAKAPAAREYLADNDPGTYSMLHTSISPNMIKAGYQINVIPSDAEATLDIRALPDENIDAFLELMRKVINDPSVQVVPMARGSRPAPRLRASIRRFTTRSKPRIEKIYQTTTLPMMGTGATDMAMLRAKGVQCYGVGAMGDEEDAPKGFGAHSDQERILDEALYKHVRFFWEAVTSIAGAAK